MNRRTSPGFTLLEVLIAMVILSVAVVGLIQTASHGSRHGGHPVTRGRRRGFTLIEVVIALTIVATLLVVMFAGLRVGLAAWQRGEERAELLERTRSLAQVLTRALN